MRGSPAECPRCEDWGSAGCSQLGPGAKELYKAVSISQQIDRCQLAPLSITFVCLIISVSFQMTLLPSYDYQMMPSIMLLSSSTSTSTLGKLLSTPLGQVSPIAALASCDQGQLATNCSVESGGDNFDFFGGHCIVLRKFRKVTQMSPLQVLT